MLDYSLIQETNAFVLLLFRQPSLLQKSMNLTFYLSMVFINIDHMVNFPFSFFICNYAVN